MRLSACGRFIVLESLHIDRRVLEPLASWGARRGLRVQDAIQLAICAFNDGGEELADDPPIAPDDGLRCVAPERKDQGRVRLLRVADGVDAHEGPLRLGRHHIEAEPR
ncbi:MAG: hypothetical protein JWP97_4077 [Labilithrix sp.]|nr:hypothetical protein [Labilithrix sp.]